MSEPPRQVMAILDAAGNRLCEGWIQVGKTGVNLRDLAEAKGEVLDWVPRGPAARLLWPGATKR